jgi:SAM-dependent methyltransferase
VSIDASSAPLRHPLTSDLPPVVDAVLARHRAEVAELARGRVLVVAGSVPGLVGARGQVTSVDVTDGRLSAAAGRRDPLALPGDAAPPPGPGRVYDTVVSVGGLLTEPDLPEVLAAVDALLAPGGRLVLVDSTRSWRRGLDRAPAGLRLWPAVGRLHLHLHRDLVGALWAHRFIPLTVERFTVPTPVVPLRSWGHVVAARTDEVAVGVWA